MFEPDGLGTGGFFWLLGLVSLAAIGVWGHHIGKRGWRHALARAGSVAASALALVLAVTVTLNHTYGWYTSWSDLGASITGDHPQGVQSHFGAEPSSQSYDKAAAARVNTAADVKYAEDRATFTRSIHLGKVGPRGQWVKINVPGLGIRGHDIGRVMVWFPPGYTADSRRAYPVIEAFHGMPGGTLDYERVFFLDKLLLAEKAHKKIGDAVIIVPQEMPNGIDTECVDGGGIKEESWLTKTVPDFVTQHMYVQADMHSWATVGVSAGGWCAMMAGLLHSDRYAAMASLGGYFEPDFANGWDPFAGHALPARYDLFKQAQEHPTRQAIWLLISSGDKLSGKTSARFAKTVRAPNSVTAVDYPGAGHRVDVWQRALPDVLRWLGSTLPAFGPNASSELVTPSAKSSAGTHSGASGSGAECSSTPSACERAGNGSALARCGHGSAARNLRPCR